MTDTDIILVKGTKTHPYMATIVMDPAKWFDFERTFEDRAEVKIRKLDSSEPDAWTVYVACASEEVRDLLETNW